jgi:hypothetical protein
MKQVATDTDRKAKRMRRIARVLAAIWAAVMTLPTALLWVVVYELSLEQSGVSTFPLPPHWWLTLLLILCATWGPTAVAWRWEVVGGILLIAQGLLGVAAHASFLLGAVRHVAHYYPGALLFDALLVVLAAFALLLFDAPPLAAGSLLLASWRRSKKSKLDPDSELVSA